MTFLRHLGKFFWSLIILVLILAAIAFAISNRTMVTFSLWPLPIETPLPLGVTVLAALALGLITGTGLMAISRWNYRRRARSSERRVASLKQIVRDPVTEPNSQRALGHQ